MTSYTIALLPVPAQEFSAQMGDYLLSFKMQWLTRESAFRVDISLPNGSPLTSGRILNTGVNLLQDLYPPPASGIDYGILMLVGDEATVDNLGINNTLVYTDG